MTFDRLWDRFTRVAMFFAGLGILGYETVAEHGDRFYLLTAAIGMMGPQLARSVERLILAARNSPMPPEDSEP